MEKIKFKAWDREEKCWLTNKERVCVEDDGSISIIDFDCYDGYSLIDQDTVDICLFTGLKDKNGVDIYEGDILKGLKYGDKTFSLVDWSLGYDGDGWPMSGYILEFDDSLGIVNAEVVGNRYENPELLERL